MILDIDFTLKDARWNTYIKEDSINNYIQGIFAAVLNQLGYRLDKDNTIELSITFTNDIEIKAINNNFRQVDSATNVLSFPLYENEFIKEYNCNEYISLGDIVLSIDTIHKEACEQNKTFLNHLTHLIVHSMLHLFGYDHIKDEDAKTMETLEIKILQELSIDNPYFID